MVDIYEEAIKEAFASCPTDAVILHTIELVHSYFITDAGLPTSIKIVHNTENIIAGIEATAPIDRGKMVEFIAMPFEMILPENSKDKIPEIKITIDNVAGEIIKAVSGASERYEQIRLIYRPYLSTDLSRPQLKKPPVFYIGNIYADNYKITCAAKIKDYLNLVFLSRTYTIDQFPGLI